MVWAGDDWSDLCQEEDRAVTKKGSPRRGTRRASAGEKRGFSPSSSSTSSSRRTVTIKMTKQELVKLLEEVDTKGLSREQVMARFTGGSGDYSFSKNTHRRPWRPALQSIPEVI